METNVTATTLSSHFSLFQHQETYIGVMADNHCGPCIAPEEHNSVKWETKDGQYTSWIFANFHIFMSALAIHNKVLKFASTLHNWKSKAN